jgi:threonine dehydrogenase-like Zn-dependent dehydrogenase
MGVVEAVGSTVTHVEVGDRVVIPFNISCGHGWMCTHGLQSQRDDPGARARHGPIGQMSARIARHLGASQVFGVDLVGERLEMPRRHGVDAINLEDHDDLAGELRERTGGRGPDAVIDAVGMEAHGSGAAKAAQSFVGLLPDPVAARLMERAGVDRLDALLAAIDVVRRGGTLSISGVYGGMVDPLPMLQMFDKQLTVRMGQGTSSAGSTICCRW